MAQTFGKTWWDSGSPDMPPEVWVQKLMRQFAAMQWEKQDEM